MTRTELAQMMIDGSLDYKPENDAFFIAQGYLNLVELVESVKHQLPEAERGVIDQFLSVDPAKQ